VSKFTSPVIVGNNDFRFSASAQWAQLPAGVGWLDVVAVSFASNHNVYVNNRGDRELIYFDSDGNYLGDWGETDFVRPHGLTISKADEVYCTDDFAHTVTRYDLHGRVIQTLGTRGSSSQTGAVDVDYRKIKHSAGPFNFPTNLAIADNGDLYITDGYGNARVHQFSTSGELLNSWGNPGRGPGEFHVPHDIRICEQGMIWVADRENDRIQRFDPAGDYIDSITDLARPASLDFGSEGEIYIFELGYQAGMFPGEVPPSDSATGGRLTILDHQLNTVCRIGGGEKSGCAGDFYAPHNVRVDHQGNLYLAEVVWAAGGHEGRAPDGCSALQKLTRINAG
jgi:sugar lactone lactonase YvrE